MGTSSKSDLVPASIGTTTRTNTVSNENEAGGASNQADPKNSSASRSRSLTRVDTARSISGETGVAPVTGEDDLSEEVQQFLRDVEFVARRARISLDSTPESPFYSETSDPQIDN